MQIVLKIKLGERDVAKVKDVKDALFLLVRHGECKLNAQEKFRGWSDDESAGLDKKGIKEAKIAGRFISKLPVKTGIIVSSDLNRTIHTAAIISTILGINDIHTDARLRPLNVGTFTGKEKEGADIERYLKNPDEKFPGGESIVDFRKRQEDFYKDLEEWIKSHPDEKALEIGHLSNVVYWVDLNKSFQHYLESYPTSEEDPIHPGGVIAVLPDDEVIPLLGENKKATLSDKGEE